MKTIIIFSLIAIGIVAAIMGAATLIQLTLKQRKQQSATMRIYLISIAYMAALIFLIMGSIFLFLFKDDASINLFKTIIFGGMTIILPGILVFYLRRF